ncbi:hypothetical protein [uncultured Bacteroides sp.]|uniref:hypothetical protein n=1 Tax=uncultured Bacteroides sp. TaxID=162156 RepID=UPI0025DA6221|nr:hypothetical protein [uncultured Bacteroides sp.]
MKLYVFNPDADMALGNNEENYMAPATIRRMAEDLALLPVWYAQPGSGVLAPSAYNADFLKQMQQLFELDVQLVTEPELSDCADVQVMPWGWSPAIRKRLLKGGIPERNLPDEKYMKGYRRVASRYSGMLVFSFLVMSNFDYTHVKRPFLCDEKKGSEILSNMDPEMLDRGIVIKSLWSGSGRGLRWCRKEITESTYHWCLRLLKEDGAFIIEPIYDKVEDFAMEFYSDGKGKVDFIGYSRFTTDDKGAYRSNLLTSDSQVEEWIQQYVPLKAFIKLRKGLQKLLKAAVGKNYAGYFGVDMLVHRWENGHPYAINPCVEMNMRMNMGIVAHTINEHFVASGSGGHFSIDCFPTNEALQEQHKQDLQNYPLVVKDGRVVSGYLPLVPVTPKSCYRAFICVTAE